MKHTQCPICYCELQVKEVTPCISCGALESQVNILKQDINESFRHDSLEFNLYRIFSKFKIILCNFCAVDIGSIASEHFGLQNKKRACYSELDLIKNISNPSIGKDKYCPQCLQRLHNIEFLLSAREHNAL